MLWEIFYTITHMKTWVRVGRYSPYWDSYLIKLMENNKFVVVDEYTAMLGDVQVWCKNHPYGSFSFYDKDPNKRIDVQSCLLPRRTTAAMAAEKFYIDTGKEVP